MKLISKVALVAAVALLAGCNSDTRDKMSEVETKMMIAHVSYDYTDCNTCDPFFATYKNTATAIKMRGQSFEDIEGLGTGSKPSPIPYCDVIDSVIVDESLAPLNSGHTPKRFYLTNIYKVATGNSLVETCEAWNGIAAKRDPRSYSLPVEPVVIEAPDKFVSEPAPVFKDPAIGIELYKKATEASVGCKRAENSLMDLTANGHRLDQNDYLEVMNIVYACEQFKFEKRINGG